MKKTEGDAVRYPIGIKLIVIISVISILSLGAITALVSYMITQDIRITAEDNNFTVNKRSAAEAETVLTGLRSGVNVLLNTLDAAARLPGGQRVALAEQAASYFFDENRHIAAVASLGGDALILMNERFFRENDIVQEMLDSFLEAEFLSLRRAESGEALIRNASPSFGVPLLALIYPRYGTASAGAALVLFSSETLSETFGTGANATYMVNDASDVLVHPNAELAAVAVNLGNRPFIRSMWENPRASQQNLSADEDGRRLFAAYTRLTIANAAVITNIEETRVFEGVEATTRRNIYLSAAVLFISGLFIWLFSKTISGPVRGLASAARHIEGGNFELALKPKTRDEIGLLTTSFQKMSQALGIFGRFTNQEIALRAMRGEIRPGGLPKHATVFFSDIRGFTEKSENFIEEYGDGASDRIVKWLNEYFTRMVECVEKTGGVVDKFMGDAVMAHWGTAYTAGSPEADAYNCVKAALLMRAALIDMNKGRSADDRKNPPVRIGCGINSGIVTAGQIGSERRMEYTVIGGPVNLASRAEELNKAFGTDILITEDTWRLIGNKLITEEMPPARVKGKEKPLRIFAVVNIQGVRGPKTLAELRTLLNIKAPDLSRLNTMAEEKKYKIEPQE
ncbi:MAG: adenylate/guanylate cyclase domain-containing protein [Spirochaetaceae bacterium]|nr:adenylate/guanylate cyclase domain-containing protein [Spirochaetaceae bacterium]